MPYPGWLLPLGMPRTSFPQLEPSGLSPACASAVGTPPAGGKEELRPIGRPYRVACPADKHQLS